MEAMLLRMKHGRKLCNGKWLIGISQVLSAAGKLRLFIALNLSLSPCLTLNVIFHRHATGGSIPGLLPRLSDQELNVTQSINNTGNVILP